MWTIREIGIEYFLFGSDFPVFDLKPSRRVLEKYGFKKKELQQIFHDNAVKLFGL